MYIRRLYSENAYESFQEVLEVNEQIDAMKQTSCSQK